MPTPATFQTPLRPGERIVAGRLWIHDQGLHNDHLAVVALRTLPADLGALTDGQLRLLRAHWLSANRCLGPLHEVVTASGAAIFGEFAARGWDSSGRVVAPVAQAKAA